MAKVKIGLIENVFVTNLKLNPKVHRIVDRKRTRRVEQSSSSLEIIRGMRDLLRNSAVIHVAELKHVEKAALDSARQFLPGNV